MEGKLWILSISANRLRYFRTFLCLLLSIAIAVGTSVQGVDLIDGDSVHKAGLVRKNADGGDAGIENSNQSDANLTFEGSSATEKTLLTYWNGIKETETGKDATVVAASLGLIFKKFIDIELAGKKISEHYGALQFEVKRSKSLEEQAMIFAEQLANQFYEYKQALDNMAASLLHGINEPSGIGFEQEIQSCCDLKAESLKYDKFFRTKVNKHVACKTIPSKKKPSMFIPNGSFNKVFVENAIKLPYIKWQYFISPEGVYIEYPGNNHNCDKSAKLAQPVLSSKAPSAKKLWLIQNTKDDARNHRIVFLLQLGPDTTPAIIKSIRSTVLLILKFLDESDEIGIVNSDTDPQWSDFLCDQMVPATSWTRYQIMDYLSYVEKKYLDTNAMPPTDTDQFQDDSRTTASGIQKAINMACANYSSYSPSFPPTASTIIHLRSGVNLDGFRLKSFQVDCPIYIDTLILTPLSSDKEDAYRKQIQGYASRNVWRVQVWSTAQAEPENFASKVALKLNSKKDWWSLSDILSQFFPKPKERYPKGNDFSFPHYNTVSKEAVVVAKKYVFHSGGAPVGLVALEIPLTYFTQQVTYYVDENSYNGKNYAFMIDKQGRVLSHPALGRPESSQESLSSIQIDQIEVHFSLLKRKILDHDRGCESIIVGTRKSPVTYAWSSTLEFQYIVVLVFQGEDAGCATFKQDYNLRKGALNPKADVEHHLLLKERQYCYKQPVSLRKASLYVAPNAFYRPADIINPQFSSQVKLKEPVSLMEYLTDSNGYRENQNKGLKPSVRDHIAALSIVAANWKFQYFTSEWSKYVLRRFGSGGGGTFLIVFPGSTITNGYVPSSSRWFKLSSQDSWLKKTETENKRRVYFTPPVIDYNTGVPFVTISNIIQANVNASGLRPTEMTSVAVVGADVNLGFFQRLIEELMPECAQSTSENSTATRCLLVDESGYVIYHPQLLHSLKTLRDIHITQLEPLFVIDILQYSQSNHFVPMEKKICHKLSEASSTQGSMQRFYQISAVPDGFLKLKHGEHVERYKIAPIRGTNLHFVVIQDARLGSNAFCPCSTIDKLCLNCMRMDPSDCECPCECPREPSFCSPDDYSLLPEDVQPCDFADEKLPMVQDEALSCTDLTPNSAEFSQKCNSECVLRRSSCNKYYTPNDCFGLMDCTWCTEGNYTISGTPACTTYTECYGYARQKSTHKVLDLGEAGRDESSNGRTPNGMYADTNDDSGTAIIPAVGVLLVFIVFLVLVFYCYRHRALNASSSNPDLHLLPLQDSPRCSIVPQAGSSRSDSDGEPFQVVPLHPVGGSRAGRRRQNRFFAAQRSPLGSIVATDSDHGYSTMTPHDDSECGATLPFVLIDPPSRTRHSSQDGKDNYASETIDAIESVESNCSATAMSKLTSTIQSPVAQPEINQIIVPVTVHELAS